MKENRFSPKPNEKHFLFMASTSFASYWKIKIVDWEETIFYIRNSNEVDVYDDSSCHSLVICCIDNQT